ncbi:conserved Plasmodium protein, unknown function [Plasmodium relictum]|uniref:Uncharacterized protein n=1 Tax=Plasmodium relictum TaxID=85471 RepID=A0A1J1HDR5_PLARL|nr:conserved Plasmodium protein, unknown function [Plasmodium relictum]CRH03693.1 conserved Plasmodium protein, unknown function [Plasmodium relictum]
MLKKNDIFIFKKWCNINKKKKRNKKKKKIKKLSKWKYLCRENLSNRICDINEISLTHNVKKFVNYHLKENIKRNSNMHTSIGKKKKNYSEASKKLNNEDISINLLHIIIEYIKLKILLKKKFNLNNISNKYNNENNFFSDSTSASSKGFYEFANENNSIFQRRKTVKKEKENFEYINKVNSNITVEIYSLFTFFCTKLKVKENIVPKGKNLLNKFPLNKNALNKKQHGQKISREINNKQIPKNKEEKKNDTQGELSKDPSKKIVENNNDQLEKGDSAPVMNGDQNSVLNASFEKEETTFNFDEKYILGSNKFLGELEKDEYNDEGNKKEKTYYTDRCILDKNQRRNSILNKLNMDLNDKKNIGNMNNNETLSSHLSDNKNKMTTFNKSNEKKRIANLREINKVDDEKVPKEEGMVDMKTNNKMDFTVQNNEIVHSIKGGNMSYPVHDMQMNYPMEDMQMNYPMEDMQMNYPMEDMQMNYPMEDMQMNYPMGCMQMNYPMNDLQMKHPMSDIQVDYSIQDTQMKYQLNNSMGNSVQNNNLPSEFPMMRNGAYPMNNNSTNNYGNFPNNNCNKMFVNSECVDKRFNLNNKNLVSYNNEKGKCDEDFTLNYIIQKYDDDDKFFCSNNNLANDDRNNELKKYTEGMNKVVEQMYFYDHFHDEYKICDEKVNSSNDTYNVIDTSLNLNVINENENENKNDNKESKKIISKMQLKINELEKNIEELMNKNKQKTHELVEKKENSYTSNKEKSKNNNIINKLQKEIEQIKKGIFRKKKKKKNNNNNNKSFKVEKEKEEKKEDEELVKDTGVTENNNFNLDNIINHDNLNNLKNEILDNVYYYIYESYDQKDYEILENLAKKHETKGRKICYNVNLPKYNFNHKRTSSAWFLNPVYENYMLEKRKEEFSKIEKAEFLFNEDKINDNSKKEENNCEFASEIRDSEFSYESFISEKKKKLKRSKMDLIKIKNSMIHKKGKSISLEQNMLSKRKNDINESVNKKQEEQQQNNSKKEEMELYHNDVVNDIFGVINNYVQDKSVFDIFNSISYVEGVENKKVEEKEENMSITKEILKKKKEKELLDLEIENKKKKKELEELELQLMENKKKKIAANKFIQDIEEEMKLKEVKAGEIICKDVMNNEDAHKENNKNLIRKDENVQDIIDNRIIKKEYANNMEENNNVNNEEEKNTKDVEKKNYVNNEEEKDTKDVEKKNYVKNEGKKDSKDDMPQPLQQKETDDYFNDYCRKKKKEKKKNNWALYGRPIVKREKKNMVLKKLSASKSDNGFNDYTFIAEKFFEVITGYKSEPDNLSDYDEKSNVRKDTIDKNNEKENLLQLNKKKVANLNRKMKQNIYENEIFYKLGRPKYGKNKRNYYKKKSSSHNTILKKNSINKKSKLLKRTFSKNNFSKFDTAHAGILEKAKLKLKEKLINYKINLNSFVDRKKKENGHLENDLIYNIKKDNIINNENNQDFDLKYKRKLIYQALDTSDLTIEKDVNEIDEMKKEDLDKSEIESILIDKTYLENNLRENKKEKIEDLKKVGESKKQDKIKILEEMKKQEEIKRLEEMKKQEEIKRLEEMKKQEEIKRLEEMKKQEEKRLEEIKKREEAKILEEMKKQEEKRLEEIKKREEAKILEEMKKQEEKRLEEIKKREEAKILEEMKKQEEKRLEEIKKKEEEKILEEMKKKPEKELAEIKEKEEKKKGIFIDFFKKFYQKNPLSYYLPDDKDKTEYLVNDDEYKPIKGMNTIFFNTLEKNLEKDINNENDKFTGNEIDSKEDIDTKKKEMKNLNNIELSNYNIFDQKEKQRKRNFRERMSKNKIESNKTLKRKYSSNKVGNKSLVKNSYKNNSIIINNLINKKKDEEKLKEEKLKEEKLKEEKLKEEKMREEKLKEEKMREEKKKKLLKMRNKNLKYNSLHEEHLRDLIEKNMSNNENFLPVDEELYVEEKDDIFETETESSFLKIDDNDYVNLNSLKTHIYNESNNGKKNDNKLREYFKNNYESSNAEIGSMYPMKFMYSGELNGTNSYNIFKNDEIIDDELKNELNDFDIKNELGNLTNEILNDRNINLSYSDNFSKNYEDIYFDFEKNKLDSEGSNSYDLNSYNLYEDISNNSMGTKKNSNSFGSLKSSFYKQGDPFTNYSFEKILKNKYNYNENSSNVEKKNDEIITNIMNNLNGLNKRIKSIEMNYNFEREEKDKLDMYTHDLEKDKKYSYFNYQNKNKFNENKRNKYEDLYSNYYYR